MGKPLCRLLVCLFIKHITVFYISSECKTLRKSDLFPFPSEFSVGSYSTPWDSSAILGQERTAFKIQTLVFRLSMVLKVALPVSQPGNVIVHRMFQKLIHVPAIWFLQAFYTENY